MRSGWATAVLVAGPSPSPEALDRRVVDRCDPAIPASRQPYQAALGKLETEEAKVPRRRQGVVQAVNRSVPALLPGYRAAGHRLGAVGLVVGPDTDPARITNPHMRAHALEGQLFRVGVEEAVRSCDRRCLVFAEPSVYRRAAEALGRSAEDLKGTVTRLGRPLGGAGRADEKTACLAAWLARARGPVIWTSPLGATRSPPPVTASALLNWRSC